MKNYLSLIKFAHTIFALPFAILGFALGYFFSPPDNPWLLFVLIVLCMVFARSAAMTFNRYIDRMIDVKNPRTASREIPSGLIKPGSALFFTIANALLFIAATYFINPICFYLSPIALLIVLGYSYTKKFTWLCHLVLGLGLSLAPIGAYLAVTGQFSILPLLYGAAVLCWVAGFDIIYALQDVEFDRDNSLHSIPEAVGVKRALIISSGLHILCSVFLVVCGFLLMQAYPQAGFLNWIAVVIFISFLIYQHTIVSANDFSRINLAFFTTNGIASIIFSTLIVLDLFLK